MYQVLLNSDFILKSLLMQDGKFAKELDKFWEILKSSEEEKYTGYITEDEWSKLSIEINKNCDVASEILSSFSKVLNIAQINESTDFTYIISEQITSSDLKSKNVSVEQFLMRYEAEKMHSLPYEEGVSEPILIPETNSLMETNPDDILSNDGKNDDDGSYFADGSQTDYLTGFNPGDILCSGEENDLLNTHNFKDYLAYGSETNPDDILSNDGKNDLDLLDIHDDGSYFADGSQTDYLTGFNPDDESESSFDSDNDAI